MSDLPIAVEAPPSVFSLPGSGFAGSRKDRQAALGREVRARRTGKWGGWKHWRIPRGMVGGDGWPSQVDEAFSNDLYSVLKRDAPFGVIHLAIRTHSNAEPPWRDLQRIKNELYGPERFAMQVCPAASRLVDAADLYHLWIMPEGFHPGFGLDSADEAEG